MTKRQQQSAAKARHRQAAADYRKRQTSLDFVQVAVWIPRADKDRLHAFAEQRRAMARNKTMKDE